LTSIAVAVGVLLAGFSAWLSAHALVRWSVRNPKALDSPWGGVRKVHIVPTPRIGGIAIAAGCVAGAAVSCVVSEELCPWSILLLCAAPGFAWGLIEDYSARGAVAMRLVVTAAAASLAFFVLDARIVELDVPGLDWLLQFGAFSFVFTVFAVTGVAHSINVIDGLNGLSGVIALLASIGLAIVAAVVGDEFVLRAASVLGASVAGFLAVNYPRGRIFLGDGGAYLVGLVLAVLSVLVVQRNSGVSPWFPLVLLAYPIWETLFSMYRRKARGHSSVRADALHLHTLVYRRLVRWRSFTGRASDYVTRNSVASLCLWPIPLAGLSIALVFWDHSAPLQIAAAAFAIVYALAYRRLVRFRVPAWLVVRARSEPREAEPAELSAEGWSLPHARVLVTMKALGGKRGKK
jgi:UDP-N-acetylmuramyl pentapeptide phosphotransferase/UDP-N-acetylglucosamine-1-phosphate transferase